MGIQINGQTDTVTSTTAGGSVKVTPLAASTGLNVGTGASISSPATNVLTLGTNNTERVRIDSNGNIGIGTTNSTTKLIVSDGSGTVATDILSVAAGGIGNGTFPKMLFETIGNNNVLGRIGVFDAGATSAYAGSIVFETNTGGSATRSTVEQMRINYNGNVGIGTNTIPVKLTIKPATNTYQLYLQQNNVSDSGWKFLADSSVGDLIFYREGGGTNSSRVAFKEAGGIQLTTASTNIQNSSGNPILRQTGSVVQTQYVSSGTRTTVDSTTFTEPSSSYRVSITPTSTSNYIVLHYFIPGNLNGAWAANTIFSFRAWREIGGGARSYALTSAGGTNGSRNVIAGITNRPPGSDGNDPTWQSFTVIDAPNTTSACVYGFEYKRETGGGGTFYFGYSQGDTSNWGFDSDIVITAMEVVA